MKNHIISVLFILLSIPNYLCVLILYIYCLVMSKPVILITKICKVDKICVWADSIDRFFVRMARYIF